MSNGNSQHPNQPPQQQMDMNSPVMIVLPYGAWQAMTNILAKSPWEQVNGMIVVINQQLQSAIQQRQQAPQQTTQPRAMIGERD